jgi:MEMO1 family protein
MGTREASHAGSWYSASGSTLKAQLDEWLSQVPDELPGIGKIPVPGARVVISPHAGYAYSGPCAAWAYKCLDLSKAYALASASAIVPPSGASRTTDPAQ